MAVRPVPDYKEIIELVAQMHTDWQDNICDPYEYYYSIFL
jgi:hypothetical protein